jgi:uncharacterized damage-inducible protein DinB
MSVESLFLQFSVDKLRQFTSRIEVCLGKLSEDQIWTRGSENENAIGNLVLHLSGNVRQWILSSLANDATARDRDSEFSARGGTAAPELAAMLRKTVEEAASVISGLDTERLLRYYEIQNYRVSGVEVVFHVVEHFGQHAGQIIFATKAMTGNDLEFYRHLSSGDRSEQAP